MSFRLREVGQMRLKIFRRFVAAATKGRRTGDSAKTIAFCSALGQSFPAQNISVAEGRVYGGGLHKVEPKELAQIPARAILDRLDADFAIDRQARLFV